MTDRHLPLEDMTVEEKLRAMEALWDDLCQRAEGVPTPAWHGKVLMERAAAVERSDESIEDWETAKTNITKRTK